MSARVFLGLLPALLLLNVSAAGRVWLVPAQFMSIQKAIDKAAPHDTVLIAMGIYQQRLHLDGKPLTLASRFLTTGDSTLIRATILHGGGIEADSAVIALRGDSLVTITGLSLTGGGQGIRCAAPVEIRNCVIYNNRDGVAMLSHGSGRMANCVIERNPGNAVVLDGNAELSIENSVLRDNDGDGIEMRLPPWDGRPLQLAVKHCMISGNGGDGVQIVGYNESTQRLITLSGNLFADNEMAAVACMNNAAGEEDYRGAPLTERIEILGNTFLDNPFGIVGGAYLNIVDNRFLGCSRSALRRVGVKAEIHRNMAWECTRIVEEMPEGLRGFILIAPYSEGRPGIAAPLTPGVESVKRNRWIPAAPPKQIARE